jgi:hypothetical protein
MNTENNGITITEELSSFLNTSPIIKDFLKKKSTELIAQRAEKIEDKKILNSELLKVAKERAKLDVDTLTALANLEASKRKIITDASSKVKPLAEKIKTLENAVKTHDSFLRCNYDPAIDQALEFFREKLDSLLLKIPYRSVGIGDTKLSGLQEYLIQTNRAAILQAIDYARTAIQELGAMKTEQAACDERINQLKAEIPNTELLNETISWTDAKPRDVLHG